MRKRRRSAAFTFTEIMISMTLAGVLGSIIYLVSTEALASFARNASINRSYTDARITIDRLAQTIASAGHVPILVDTNGAPTTVSPAAGIRFYRANPNSNYQITAGLTNSSNVSIVIKLASGQTMPGVNDICTIPTLGYQGIVSSYFAYGSGYNLTFTHLVSADCSPPATTTIDLSNPQLYTQSWTQVAFIVVGNQLRYYSHARSVANDTAAVFNNPTNYDVAHLVNLASAAYNSSGTAATPLLPFSVVNSPTVTVQLYAQNPDYSNRTTAISNNIGSANTYTFMQSSLGPRSPTTTVRAPY